MDTKEQASQPALQSLKEYAVITAAVLIMDIGIYVFKFPNNFSFGGVSGMAVVICRFLPFTASQINLFINLLLLLVGFAVLGRNFGVKTAYVTVLSSVLLNIFEKLFPMAHPLTDEIMLELCFAIILPALAAALLFFENASGGGTDIMPLLKNEVRDDKDFVFLKKIPELHVLEEKDGELIIGATMTLTELAESALLNSRYAAIAQAASLTASPQIRNIATVGGNIMQDRRCIYFNQPHLWRSGLAYCFKTGGSICHQIPNSPVCRAIYYSDVATALIAYEAEVEYIEDGETHRTDLASLIERHSVANGLACHEHLPILVTRFFVPAAEEGECSGFYKYAMRTTIDFPIINFALRCGGNRPARLAAGAVAPHPVVMAETAAKIDSDATDDEVIAQAEDELRKLAMPIKEACMTPAVKRSLYRHVAMLLNLRK